MSQMEETEPEVECRQERPAGRLPRTIVGRYRCVNVLGTGGFGAVYRAVDTITGDEVALKVLTLRGERALAGFRDEVALLRLLDLPGVVRLLDDGVDGADAFLVTQLVDGRPFPGFREGSAAATWDEIADVTASLLEALGRVHAHDVIHRDLKPANILVDRDGRPMLLDFGVSWGPGFDPVEGGTIAGTPAYLAPEQALGLRGDERTDLYTIGVILFAVLAGRFPHQARTSSSLLQQKIYEPAPPLRSVAPCVPERVALTVDQLLRTEPIQRPDSATTVLEMLGGPRAQQPLPRLGDPHIVRRVADALCAGRSVDVYGPTGSGRSRLLTDVAAELHKRGQLTRVVQTGALGSLAFGETLPREQAAVEASAETDLRPGSPEVLIADDATALDPVSARALDEVRRERPVLRTTGRPSEADELLQPLLEEDLRPIFHGPDRVLHLAEDGARELARRTDGRPRSVARVVGEWVRAGLCTWDGGRLRVDRIALDRLSAGLQVGNRWGDGFDRDLPTREAGELVEWVRVAGENAETGLLESLAGVDGETMRQRMAELQGAGVVLQHGRRVSLLDTVPRGLRWGASRLREAHAELASRLKPGTAGRFVHLVRLGDAAEAAAEALHVAVAANETGRLGDAMAVVAEAITISRRAGMQAHELALLEAYATTALASQSPRALNLALYHSSRAADRSPRARRLERLLDAARVVRYVERSARAIDVARSVAPIDDHVELERWRRASIFVAGYGCTADEHAAIGEEQLDWARGLEDAAVAAGVGGWLGLARFRQGRFEESAALHERAWSATVGVRPRLNAGLNGAQALIEAGQLEQARVRAEETAALARASRIASAELRATWLLSSIAYRTEPQPPVDRELVELAGMFGPSEVAVCAMTQSAAHWRRGDLTAAVEFANASAAAFSSVGDVGGALLVSTFCRALLGEPAEQVDPLPEEIPQGVRRQILAMGSGRLPIDRVKLDFPRREILSELEIESLVRGNAP